jgi:uncharacterized protein YjiS (DUF1127 family)
MDFTFIKRYFQERKVYLRIVEELSYCTDRDFKELGFERLDIHRIARQAAKES